MDTFSEFLKEVVKEVIRAISAYVFQKTFLNKEKTTLRRDKQKGGPQKSWIVSRIPFKRSIKRNSTPD